jgi:16S rRNA (cytosine967-C5)-methyltransferase
MGTEKPRQIAARLLLRHAARAQYLEVLLDQALAGAALSPADRGLVQELACGVVRWQATLDWLVACRTGGRTQKRGLQVLLRLGLYQLFWLDRIPDHAAVHETVELAKQLGFGPQAGFVNAILRSCLRERAQIRAQLVELKNTSPTLGWSHPDWLCSRWQRAWGEDPLRQLLEWNNTPPRTYARLNTLRATADQLAAQWRREGVEAEPRAWDWTSVVTRASLPGALAPPPSGAPPAPWVFELASHPPLAALPSLQQGLFYVQDPGTLLSVVELAPRPGETILDCCAAPGGKTTFMAQLMRNEGRIVARDPNPARRDLLRENCTRLGVTCVEVQAPPSPPLSPGGAPGFDRILVDAPCSNTGVMRRRVDLRWRLRPEEITRLAAVQLDLLHAAAPALKPGGTLVYSTCSLEPEENGEVVQRFLAAQEGFRLEHERTLLPFVEGVDGAYVARLAKVSLPSV